MARSAGAAELSGGKHQTISFGLVNVPVRIKPIFKPERKTKLSANYICPDHRVKVKQRYFCENGDHYPDKIRAYDVDGVYVDEPDADVLETLLADKTGELAIEQFVDPATVSPLYFSGGKGYWIGPDEGGTRTYVLLATAMRESGMAAIAKAVLTGAKSTQLILIRWDDDAGCLVAHSCAYDQNINWGDAELVARVIENAGAPAKAELDLATQILGSLAGKFDPAAVADTYNPALREIIEQLAKGKKPKAAPKAAPKEEAGGDLMAALRQSVADAKAAPKGRSRSKAKAA